MIYKIYDENQNNSLELEQIDINSLSIKIIEGSNYETEIVIDNSRLYRLLGALHSIQKDLPVYNPKIR